MKCIPVLILIALVLALLAACGSAPPSPPAETSPAPEEGQAAAPEPEPPAAELPEPYRELLARYVRADAEQWDPGRLTDEGLNILCRYCWESDTSGEIGYLVEDLDGNGTPELLIGVMDGENFTDRLLFDLYTLTDGEPVTLFQGWERNRWFLLSDGRFYNYGSASAEYSWTSAFTLEDGALVASEGIALYSTNEADSYFQLDPHGEDGEALMNDEAEAQLDAWAEACIQPDFIPLSQYK